ncbi:MAG: DUF362 domain-containing protein, partial [candidate division WOR-3 bacterium]
MKDLTRRDFLRTLSIGAAGLLVRPRLVRAWERFGRPLGGFSSDVVQCYDEAATSGNAVNEPVVQVMMDESIKALTGINDVGEAWKSLFPGITENSVISIKVNCASPQCPSRPETVSCIINGLVQMNLGSSSFKRNNVIVWERTNSELTAAGYTLYTGSDPETARCFGSNQSGIGYDTSTPLNVNGVTSYPSRILSQLSDYCICLPVLKTHATTSVTLNLKNHYGSVNNASSLQHTNGARAAIPSLNQQIRDVVMPNSIQKLWVIDGLFGMYSGGPGGAPNFNPKLLVLSRDPVACDCQGLAVINAERQRQGLGALTAPHITNAAQPPYNLGSTEINLIELFNPTGLAEAQPRVSDDTILRITPNPFRTQTELDIRLGRAAQVEVNLVTISGRIADHVFSGRLPPGRHRIAFRPQHHVASG